MADQPCLNPAQSQEIRWLAMTIVQTLGFVHSPGDGAYSLYFVRVTGATSAEGAITSAGLWEIEGPVGAARSVELQAEYSTLALRLEAPVSRAVYIVFDAEINGRRIENTTALYSCTAEGRLL
jgi:hypothetical protein